MQALLGAKKIPLTKFYFSSAVSHWLWGDGERGRGGAGKNWNKDLTDQSSTSHRSISLQGHTFDFLHSCGFFPTKSYIAPVVRTFQRLFPSWGGGGKGRGHCDGNPNSVLRPIRQKRTTQYGAEEEEEEQQWGHGSHDHTRGGQTEGGGRVEEGAFRAAPPIPINHMVSQSPGAEAGVGCGGLSDRQVQIESPGLNNGTVGKFKRKAVIYRIRQSHFP